MQPERQFERGRTEPAVLYRDAVRESALSTNKVLRSTYLLLSATLLFSAAIGIGRIAILRSGFMTAGYLSMYSTTAALTTIAVVQLAVILRERRRGQKGGQCQNWRRQ